MSENITYPPAHEALWERFSDFDYRHGFAEGFVGDFLATQLRTMRLDRNLTQMELATLVDSSQPQICEWENSCEGANLSSLQRLAEALDVAVVAKFVPFSELAHEVLTARAGTRVVPFEEDSFQAIRSNSSSVQVKLVSRSANRRDESDQRNFRTHSDASTGFAEGRDFHLEEAVG